MNQVVKFLIVMMSSEFDTHADASDTWEVVSSNLGLDDFHFIPAVAKSKIGSSMNLPKPAPLPVPIPQPKKGHYELPRSQPLGIPKFRPLCSSAVAKPLDVSSPIAPAVVLQSSSKMPVFSLQSDIQTNDSITPCQFPAQKGSSMAATASTRTKYPSQCAQLTKLFLHCVQLIGPLCKLHSILMDSRHPTLHFHRVLDQFAASTVWRYLSIWQHFAAALRDMDLQLERLTEVELADVFVSLSLSHRSDPSTGAGSISAIKAVRWMAKVAEIKCLQDIIYGSIISSYLKSKIPKERKEAVPLALYIVLQWERRILQTNCPVRDVILLGSFLVCLYASLRFSDLQRVKWSSIVFDYRTMRGSCWRTKTSASGQPFGLWGSGMLSRGDHGWCFKWLQALDFAGYMCSTTHLGMDPPDFLLPNVDEFGVVEPLEAMTYPRALKLLRWCASLPWKQNQPELPAVNLTLHSLKTTMLSWGVQIADTAKISLEERQTQGHHRLHGASQSVKLYSRDDVFSQLSFQEKLIKGVQNGFRFAIPQHRGGQRPLREPDVGVLEAFKKSLPNHKWMYFDFTKNAESEIIDHPEANSGNQTAEQVDSSSSSSDDESDTQSSGDEPEPKRARATLINDTGIIDELLVAFSSNTQHGMVQTQDDQGIAYGSSVWKTACGAYLNSERVKFNHEPSPDRNFCRRKACVKIWARLS